MAVESVVMICNPFKCLTADSSDLLLYSNVLVTYRTLEIFWGPLKDLDPMLEASTAHGSNVFGRCTSCDSLS